MEAFNPEMELTTRQAADRYRCENYSTFHNRMTKLGIRPERRGRQSFLSSADIELLDRLDDHLKVGGTFSNFVIEEGEVQQIKKGEIVKSSNTSITKGGSVGEVEFIAALQAFSAANYDILTPQKKLLEAVENQFLLTTEQVAKLVGLKPTTIGSWETETRRLGFIFHKEYDGHYVLWRVSR